MPDSGTACAYEDIFLALEAGIEVEDDTYSTSEYASTRRTNNLSSASSSDAAAKREWLQGKHTQPVPNDVAALRLAVGASLKALGADPGVVQSLFEQKTRTGV